MNRAEVEAKVKEIIVDHSDILLDDYDCNASLVDDFGADSLDIMEMLVEIEKTFEISIPDDKAEQIRTPQEAVELICLLLREKESSF